jgi:hypothetical protein
MKERLQKWKFNKKKISTKRKKPPKKLRFWNKLRRRDKWKKKWDFRNSITLFVRSKIKIWKENPKPWF